MEYVQIQTKEDYAILHLNRGKVNALNMAMVGEIRTAVRSLEVDRECRGMIITGKPHYFSAGLDLIELSQYDEGEIRAFWESFFYMMIELTKFSKPSIAAITGHSPAGGAVIAITCDHRFMAEGSSYTIGLNEVAVGIVINEPIFDLYRFWLGSRAAYQALYAGKLFSVQNAYEVGLVDSIYPLDQLLDAAEQKMRQVLQANDHVLKATKSIMRRRLWKQMDIDLSADLDARAKYWMSPVSQAAIRAIVDRLTQKK